VKIIKLIKTCKKTVQFAKSHDVNINGDWRLKPMFYGPYISVCRDTVRCICLAPSRCPVDGPMTWETHKGQLAVTVVIFSYFLTVNIGSKLYLCQMGVRFKVWGIIWCNLDETAATVWPNAWVLNAFIIFVFN
jgi:hypothetical protein